MDLATVARRFVDIYDSREPAPLQTAYDACQTTVPLPVLLTAALEHIIATEPQVDLYIHDGVLYGIIKRPDAAELFEALIAHGHERLRRLCRKWIRDVLLHATTYVDGVPYDDFLRLLSLTGPSPLFTVKAVHSWIHCCIRGPLSHAQIHGLLERVQPDVFDLSSYPKSAAHYTHVVLDWCRQQCAANAVAAPL